jgi:peptidoglycan/xylan/chitin deacetylase (PgdA/CDA1 family)
LEVDQRLDLADFAEIWRPMTEKQLAHLTATPLVTLGAHGVTHVALDGRRPKEICDEVEEGRTWLEQVTGRVVDLFAWPFGRYDREGIRLVREAGFRHQLLVDPHFAHDIEAPDLHPRFVINPHVAWPVAIHAILRGSW